MLQNALRRLDRHKLYHERSHKVNVIDQKKETTQNSETLTPLQQKEEEDSSLPKFLTGVTEPLPQSYRK